MALTSEQELALLALLDEPQITLAELPVAKSLSAEDLFLTRQGTTECSANGEVMKQFLSPPASTVKSGIVRLSNNIDPNNEQDAVTPKAVSKVIVPAYIPLPCPVDIAPEGFVFCHGQVFNTAAYPELFTAYPTGRLPDLRGMVIKGTPEGRQVLSYEEDSNKRVTVTGETDDADIGTLPTSVAPPHDHDYQNLVGAAGVFTALGGNGNNAAVVRKTAASGEHSHSVTIPPHKHNFTIHIPGADEVTVKNRAFNYVVRLA